MTTPAAAIQREIRNLTKVLIETFGQHAPLTSSELEDFRYRAERIKLLGQEFDHIRTKAILQQRFAKVA